MARASRRAFPSPCSVPRVTRAWSCCACWRAIRGVELTFVSSEQYRGQARSRRVSVPRGIVDSTLEAPDPEAAAAAAEIVFAALPHGASAPIVVAALRQRARGSSTCRRISACAIPGCTRAGTATHPAPELLRGGGVRAAGALSRRACGRRGWSRCRAAIRRARCSGSCRSRARGSSREPVVIDAKSGTTGAGRSAKVEQLFAEVNENFRAVRDRRRTATGPRSSRSCARAGAPAGALFVPHLLPRQPRHPEHDVRARAGRRAGARATIFERAYAQRAVRRARGEASRRELREVRGTNRCAIGWRWDAGRAARRRRDGASTTSARAPPARRVQCMNVAARARPRRPGSTRPALVP